MSFYCTYLDHLDENWRMKQIKAIIQATDQSPHILVGGLNSLDETDYSPERWSDIVKARNSHAPPLLPSFLSSSGRMGRAACELIRRDRMVFMLVQYYEEMGKPTPKAEVMRFLKGREYVDAKDFAGECEPVVVIAKGQSTDMFLTDHLFFHIPGEITTNFSN